MYGKAYEVDFHTVKKKVCFIFDHLLLPAIQNNTENATLKSVSTGTIHISEFLNALSTLWNNYTAE